LEGSFKILDAAALSKAKLFDGSVIPVTARLSNAKRVLNL
jgi:hypothetical protein